MFSSTFKGLEGFIPNSSIFKDFSNTLWMLITVCRPINTDKKQSTTNIRMTLKLLGKISLFHFHTPKKVKKILPPIFSAVDTEAAEVCEEQLLHFHRDVVLTRLANQTCNYLQHHCTTHNTYSSTHDVIYHTSAAAQNSQLPFSRAKALTNNATHLHFSDKIDKRYDCRCS